MACTATQPTFLSPERKPRTPDQTFIIAYFAYHEDIERALIPGARREIQQLLRRSSGSGVSRMLTTLHKREFLDRDPAFLDGVTVKKRGVAYRYGLWPTMPDSEISVWVELGRRLYSPDSGLLGHFLTRPAAKHSYIMLNGFLVLSVLLKHGPLREREMVNTMLLIMGRNTSRKRLRALLHNGLIQYVDGKFIASPDWENAALDYERRHGLVGFASVQDEQIAEERKKYYLNLAGGVALVELKKRLRRGTCIGCGSKPAGQVEHFPPKHWGGFDHPVLLFSVCFHCNNKWGQVVKQKDFPTLLPPVCLHLREETSAERFASAALDLAHNDFLLAFRLGDVALLESAGSRFQSAFPLWKSIVLEGGESPYLSTECSCSELGEAEKSESLA